MTTASTCRVATARGSHVFKIANYSLHKGLGSGKFIRSGTFTVGGYNWSLGYYPDGEEGGTGDVAAHLELVTKNAKVRALFDFLLVNEATGDRSLPITQDCPKVFSTIDVGRNVWGADLTSPSYLDDVSSPYLRNNCLLIECEVTVVKEPHVVSDLPVAAEIRVPPSTFLNNLGKLLETGEGADVTFEMIAVEDMEPDVFKMLLTYIYTDSLLSMDGLEGGDKEEMLKHLLVAADRYGIERMKSMCESFLCESLDVEHVAATLALADQHHCTSLKDACIEFMSCPDRIHDVAATQGYKDLKTSYPAMLVDVLERANKNRKI
ncbi:hypothetical protein EJB05_30743, partial [Eragrostis curvula]